MICTSERFQSLNIIHNRGNAMANGKEGALPLFVAASLPEQTERQAFFASNFNDPRYFKIVTSVDGRNWTDEDADIFCSEEVRELRKNEKHKGKFWFRTAAVACAITHRDKLLP